MLSVSTTMYKKISVLIVLVVGSFSLAHAQTDNSPYSRYGLGDVVPSQNILTRGMGGVSAAYYDFQSINFINPASYSRLKVTTFDLGLEVNSRTIRAVDPPRKYNNASPNISYVQIGVPLSQKRNWGLNFGLRPITRINYKINRNERLEGIDSVRYLFEGNGGSYEVYAGTGYGFKNFSFGINAGYFFGSKDYSTRTQFIPDSAHLFYYKSNHETKSNYGGFLLNGGIQYKGKLNDKLALQLGAYGNLRHNFNATSDIIRETYMEGTNGNVRIDSVAEFKDVSGSLVYPATYGVGFILNRTDRWMIGMDYTASKWSEYTFFGQPDLVQDSWKLELGGQVVPNSINPKTYFGRVAYRAGLTYGRDFVFVNNQDLPVYMLSLGAGLPMRRANYTNQFSVINTTIEIGQRGNKNNPVRESFFRVAVGLTLSDLWFQKRKYE
jgi:hypothetical protein